MLLRCLCWRLCTPLRDRVCIATAIAPSVLTEFWEQALVFGPCRVPSSLRPFFTGVSQNARDQMFTRTQVQDALAEYAEYNRLSSDSPHAVKLDSLMVSMLFNKKDPVIEGNPHPIHDLEEKLISRLQLFHHARRKDTAVRSSFLGAQARSHCREFNAPCASELPWQSCLGIARVQSKTSSSLAQGLGQHRADLGLLPKRKACHGWDFVSGPVLEKVWADLQHAQMGCQPLKLSLTSCWLVVLYRKVQSVGF